MTPSGPSGRTTGKAEEEQDDAKKRLEVVWNTLQRYLTDDLCEEALEALGALTVKAVREAQRRESRRLSNIAAVEQLTGALKGLPLPNFDDDVKGVLLLLALAQHVDELSSSEAAEMPKKKRGRPKKIITEPASALPSDLPNSLLPSDLQQPLKKKLGRPRKPVEHETNNGNDEQGVCIVWIFLLCFLDIFSISKPCS